MLRIYSVATLLVCATLANAGPIFARYTNTTISRSSTIYTSSTFTFASSSKNAISTSVTYNASPATAYDGTSPTSEAAHIPLTPPSFGEGIFASSSGGLNLTWLTVAHTTTSRTSHQHSAYSSPISSAATHYSYSPSGSSHATALPNASKDQDGHPTSTMIVVLTTTVFPGQQGSSTTNTILHSSAPESNQSASSDLMPIGGSRDSLSLSLPSIVYSSASGALLPTSTKASSSQAFQSYTAPAASVGRSSSTPRSTVSHTSPTASAIEQSSNSSPLSPTSSFAQFFTTSSDTPSTVSSASITISTPVTADLSEQIQSTPNVSPMSSSASLSAAPNSYLPTGLPQIVTSQTGATQALPTGAPSPSSSLSLPQTYMPGITIVPVNPNSSAATVTVTVTDPGITTTVTAPAQTVTVTT